MSANACPLRQTAELFPLTDIWNDSCSRQELEYAIANGAVGATTNPGIVLNVLKKELPFWSEKIAELARNSPEADEVEITWELVQLMVRTGAAQLEHIFREHKGMKGRISIQVNPQYYKSAAKMVEQGKVFAKTAPNAQVKIPASSAGIAAMEELTRLGISVNATLSFCVPQAVAVAEAIERGLAARERDGQSLDGMSPVCTLMMGRLDDFVKEEIGSTGVLVDPECMEWAGVAAFKKVYALFNAKQYRTRLLGAALRNHYHWSQLIGGDCALTIGYAWQKKINASDIPVVRRIDDPVEQKYIDALLAKSEVFRKGYAEDGMEVADFDSYMPVVKSVRGFLAAYANLVAVVRDALVPDV